MFHYLSNFFYNINSSQDQGNQLYDAIQAGNEIHVNKILSSHPIPKWVNIKNSFDSSKRPLFLAIYHYHIFKKLITSYNNQISSKDKGSALIFASEKGITEIVILLLKYCVNDINDEDKGWSLIFACQQGHDAVVNTLLNDNSILRLATFRERAALRKAQEKITREKNNEKKTHYQNIINQLMKTPAIALHYAVSQENLIKVTELIQLHSNQIINNDKRTTLIYACQNGLDSITDILLRDLSISTLAALDQNRALREAQHRIRGAENTAERIRYQNIIDRLMQIDAVRELAESQMRQRDSLAHLTTFAENSMAKMTKREKALVAHLKKNYYEIFKNKTWDSIRSEILSYLEFEYHKSPAIDGYHYVSMLEDNAKIPVTFFPDDTIGIHPKGKIATIYWKDINGTIHQKDVAMAEIHECYVRLNKENWLYQDTNDSKLLNTIIENFGIPFHPYQDRVCPLEYNFEFQNPSALIAYYRHPFHTAWRYLSNHNPWMDKNALFVKRTSNGHRSVIIRDKDKELFSCYWVAINDDSVVLEKGFSHEGNKKIFAHVIAEINRGHNIDERALYADEQWLYDNGVRAPEIKTTTANNLKPDAPPCPFGVENRALQSEYGHPHINAPKARDLSLEIIKDRIEELLVKSKEESSSFDNLIDKINCLEDKKILKYMRQQISDICGLDKYDKANKIILNEKEMNIYKTIINFPKEQLQIFLQRTQLWFGSERINKIHDEKLKLNASAASLFLNQGHDSYADFILNCCHNILQVCPETIDTAANKRLKNLSEQKILYHFDRIRLSETQKRDEDTPANSEIAERIFKQKPH